MRHFPAVVTFLILSATLASQQPNQSGNQGARLLFYGIDGPPYPIHVTAVAGLQSTIDFEIDGPNGSGYLLVRTSALLGAGVPTPSGLIDLDLAGGFTVLMDGIAFSTGTILDLLAHIPANAGSIGGTVPASSPWSIPLVAPLPPLFLGAFQALVSTPAQPSGFRLTAATGLSATDQVDAVYVVPGAAPGGVGTRSLPFDSITAAVNRAHQIPAPRPPVRVASSAAFTESAVFRDGVVVTGGYEPVNWTIVPGARTIVQVPNAAPVTPIEVRASLGVLPAVPAITGFDFRALGGPPLGVGGSSIAVRVVDVPASHGLRFVNCRFQAFIGRPGAAGAAGALGAAGAAGSQGGQGLCMLGNCGGAAASNPMTFSGGAGASGGAAGGDGGDGGGITAVMSAVFGGGLALIASANAGIAGSPGANGGGTGGTGGPPYTVANPFGTNYSGGDGGPGAQGNHGTSGSPGIAGGMLINQTWVPTTGGNGFAGGTGKGGGGGGGGGSFVLNSTTCFLKAGGGGGSGGKGGLGGQGGAGGQGGGAAIAVLLVDSSPVFDGCTFVTGNGGQGGDGGDGGAGGPGGTGGPRNIETCPYGTFDFRGGAGGSGGPGGVGGGGGGGAGGPAWSVCRAGTSAPVFTGANSFTTGIGGLGGAGGQGGTQTAPGGPIGPSGNIGP